MATFSYRKKVHQLKRLDHNHQHAILPTKIPQFFSNEILNEKSSKYIKFFDYPLAELLADHSTDPMQNNCRQFVQSASASASVPSDSSKDEQRFLHHQMIVRRHGKTKVVRPKNDPVLVNGFAPMIRPSSFLPSFQKFASRSPVQTAAPSMLTKVSQKKYRPRRKYQENNFSNYSEPPSSYFPPDVDERKNFVDYSPQSFHEVPEPQKMFNQSPQPPPLMSIPAEYRQQMNFSYPPPMDFVEHRPPLVPSFVPISRPKDFCLDFYHENFGHVPLDPNPLRPAPDTRSLFDKFYHFSPHSSMIHSENFVHRHGYFF